MKYAKLIDNSPFFAPNPIRHNGVNISNPYAETYLELGYKPVIFSEPTGDPPDGYYWKPYWSETDTEIHQNWRLEPYEEIPSDMAMEILFGGDNG